MPMDPALRQLALQGNARELQWALEDGADPNREDDDGTTPLFFAASNGHARCIHILVDEGADIDVFSLNLRTPLNIAASGGHTDAVCALIAEGADVELSPYLRTEDEDDEVLHIYGGRTALHWAARLGNEATVIALLRGNARIDADNKSRSAVIPCTPLSEALDRPESEERDRVVHALLRGGAAVTAAHRRVSPLCDRVAAAGGVARYGLAHNRALAAILSGGRKIPADVVPLIVSFWSSWGWVRSAAEPLGFGLPGCPRCGLPVEHNSGEGAAAFYQCRSCETYMSHTQLYSRVEPLVPKKKGPQVDPLTIPCPSCQSRVVHNSGEGKDAFFKCSSCSRYLTYHVLCELPRSQAEARVL